MLDELKENLDKADMLTLKDLKAATIAGKIRAAITDSGAFTAYAKPPEEQMQESESVLYT